MMSRTHLAVGMATALALVSTDSHIDCAVVLAGGALGGVFADVDTLKNDYKHDALIGEALAFGLVFLTVLFDLVSGRTVVHSIMENKSTILAGTVGFILLWAIGFACEHRTFTHSIIAAILFSVTIGIIYPLFGFAGLVGYLSHLILDLLNKKGIQLFFPFRRRICLNLCYASKTANTVFMIVGFIAAAALLVYKAVSISL